MTTTQKENIKNDSNTKKDNNTELINAISDSAITDNLDDISDLETLPATIFSPKSLSVSIESIIKQYTAGLIEYPSMQRGSVWGEKDQSELIESLIRGIPIPPIYVNKIKKVRKVKEKQNGEEADVEKLVEVWEILDGRQRITALADFFVHNHVLINSHLPTGYEKLKNYTYDKIMEKNSFFAGKFIGIQMPVVWMDDAPEHLKAEFFQKLNKGGRALSPGELAHSSLTPAKDYIYDIINTSFYSLNVKGIDEDKRFRGFVPASQLVHFIIQSQKKDNTFSYNPDDSQGTGWKNQINSEFKQRQTDLDNLHMHQDEDFVTCIEQEINRVCNVIDEVLGGINIEHPTNQLITNILLSLLILEDETGVQAMSHEELRCAYEGLCELWRQAHMPKLRKKMRKNRSNITDEENILLNESDTLNSKSKTALENIIENLKDDIYSNYI